MPYKKETAYNNLPILPPHAELETVQILKKTVSANKALAELHGWTYMQANPLLLLQTVSLQEAKSSSEIENVVTTNDDLYKAFSAPDSKIISPSTKEVLHYKDALWYGFNEIKQRPLGINIFIELFHKIKRRSDGIRSFPGTVLKNSYGETVYTPPDNKDDILRLLSNLENYININEGNIDPLIRLAVIHYQFECIHPFPDGNGRVGRIINVLYLIQERLLDVPILYLSSYIIEHKSDYYKALQDVTEYADWTNWILYILDAVEVTAKKTLSMIQEIRKVQLETETFVKNEMADIYSRELIELLFEQPYCKISFLVDRHIAKKQTASKYLNRLVTAGLLDKTKQGREYYFINKNLWEILTR